MTAEVHVQNITHAMLTGRMASTLVAFVTGKACEVPLQMGDSILKS